MHSNLLSAKNHAERERKQGTRFYITQLPCLLVRNRAGTYFITEINNRIPLSGHALATPQVPENIIEQPVKIGESTKVALEFFDPSAQFWRTRPRRENSIVLLHAPNPSIPVEKLTLSPLISIESRSDGPDYYLRWLNQEIIPDQSAIQSIHDQLKSKRSKKTKKHHIAEHQITCLA